ncbi:MAG TPA: endonuclease III domain-containing protein [Verrucomicrobiota bacterium]|nr:endonuclease III domain-containing protein [Verrucomicrobiota bacterium]HRZ34899.1 endonuclease III domain-containing protein [Candidatus Paceibacterota bacterium]
MLYLIHDLRQAYRLMRATHGHLHWWPASSPIEVCLGAILTQNTSWNNVERAIANLKHAASIDPRQLLRLDQPKLAALLKPAGYFNVKTRRLRSFLSVLVNEFDADLERLFAGPTQQVRKRLLGIHGIGPETADSMLLYASGHLSFVIDAYTKRIFLRHAWCPAEATYSDLQSVCVRSLSHTPRSARLDYWRDYHAQLVMVGKEYCRKRQPRCERCPLRTLLPRSPALPRDCGGGVRS